MGLTLDLFEFSVGDLSVDLGGGELGMAQHLLDESDVRPVFQHHLGHRVASCST